MQKTLFLCSRMAPFGLADLRSDLAMKLGAASNQGNAFRLHVESRELEQDEDARPFCARAIQSSDAVVLVLDGSASNPRHPEDAPVLELEVMLAAACSKPVFVLDGSDGGDPLFRLLGPEFFSAPGAGKVNVLPLNGSSPSEKVAHLRDVLAETCGGRGPGASALAAHSGWERLFLARPDRFDAFDEDGGNFPFSRLGLAGPDMMSSDIAVLLDKAEAAFKNEKMLATIYCWDAMRALSRKPWGRSDLDPTIAVLWLRALSTWSGAMAWLGLFGHSSCAAVMSTLACRQIAGRLDSAETRMGGRFASHKISGGLASTYFSLTKLVGSGPVQAEVRRKGILYATTELKRVDDARARAELLAVRGPQLLSARSLGGVIRGFSDLRESVRLHRVACKSAKSDHGAATSRIQLGAAYKELSRRTRDPISLRRGRSHLEAAYEVLEGAHIAGKEVDHGQLLMCMKHLVETRWWLGNESSAIELWQQAMSLGEATGIADQVRQLREIGNSAGWTKAPS